VTSTDTTADSIAHLGLRLEEVRLRIRDRLRTWRSHVGVALVYHHIGGVGGDSRCELVPALAVESSNVMEEGRETLEAVAGQRPP
jgi:hypothetical protein